MSCFAEKLIHAVKKRPILYVSNHPSSLCMTRKIHAWREVQKEIAEDDEYDLPIEMLKTKWKNLKDTYRKCLQSRLGLRGPNAKSLAKWSWAEEMSFLESEIRKENGLIGRIKTELPSYYVENHDCDNDFESIDLDNDNLVVEFAVDDAYSVASETPTQESRDPIIVLENVDGTRKRKKRERNEESPQRKVKKDKVDVECDGVDLLFLGYADTYKNLSRFSQASVKYGIAKLLMKAELNDLKESKHELTDTD